MGISGRVLALALLPALLVIPASCGSSGDGAKAATTTTTAATRASTTTSTTEPAATTTSSKPSGTDDEAMVDGFADGFFDRYRAGLELVYDGKTLDCVIAAFKDAALGDGSDEAVVAAYAGCGTTAQAVAGALTAGLLLENGVAPEDARCVAGEFAKLGADEAEALSTAAGEALLRSCGVDPKAFSG